MESWSLALANANDKNPTLIFPPSYNTIGLQFFRSLYRYITYTPGISCLAIQGEVSCHFLMESKEWMALSILRLIKLHIEDYWT